MTQKMSLAVRELVVEAEDLRLVAYPCDAGVWTIGIGATRLLDGSPVTPRTKPITEAQAWELFDRDCCEVEAAVTGLVTVPLTQGQFDALCSFVFNLGRARLKKSTLLKLLNAKQYQSAAREFDRWVYARDPATGESRKLAGLVTRRAAERKMFENVAPGV